SLQALLHDGPCQGLAWRVRQMPKARIAGIYPVREDLRKRRKIVEESKLPQESKDKILEFLAVCTARGLSLHREAVYAPYLNQRHRAFVALLADAGARISEILTLRIRDVAFDQYGMVLNVEGKTGPRRVRVIGDSIAYVAAWLEVHPAGKNRDSPLFTGVNEMSRKNVMSYAQSHKVLVSLKARAGLKKRIHPHLFRHTKMTEWASKVPEAVLESQAGWVPGSGMAKIYVHLSGKNVDAAILKASG